MNLEPTEHQHQAGFITWFRYKFPSVLIFAIPNGDFRSISVAKRLKKEGVVSGIPDIYIPKWHCWIEMKREKGGILSDEQKEVHKYLALIGDTVIIGYGAEDASRKVLELIKKL